MGNDAGGLATRPAKSPGPGLTADLAPNKEKESVAVEICRDGTKKPDSVSKNGKQKSLKRCVIDFEGF